VGGRDGTGAGAAQGTALSVDDAGALVIAGATGERTIVSGEVTLQGAR
jgi:hypothetical protein